MPEPNALGAPPVEWHVGEWVLIVEDDASDELLARHGLMALGIAEDSLVSKRSLADALRALEGSAPALAVVDLGLPDSRGSDTVRRIRATAPDVPLLVISAASDPDAALASLQEGADDYLVKGEYGPKDLDRAIRYARERRRLWTTARGRAERIETAERRFRSVIEASIDGILIVDTRGTIRFANEKARRLVGAPGRELVGGDFGIPMGGEEPVEVENAGGGEARFRLEMRVAPIEWEDAEAHLVVLRDITAHRSLEERLRQAQKMESLGQLTGGIAHDFNNVLTVILSGAEVLSELVAAENVEAHAELHDIELSAARAAGMVRRLLGFSRQGYLRFETIDLRAFAEEAFTLIQRVLSERVEVGMWIADDVGGIRADPAALQQILLNVVTNARDAMPGGGSLRVECSRVDIDEKHQERHPWVRPGPYESITLVDSGIGMDERTRDQIFEPFFTTKAPGSGTGLGMAMVYGLMKQHRGLVHVYSEPDRGTTVKLLFPATDASPGPVASARERAVRAGRGETVLVIEDEPALRRGLERILTQAGYGVILARDGVEGIEAYRRGRDGIDLIVSDLVMPKLGGREVLTTLRAEGDSCKFLIVTGYGPGSVAELSSDLEATVLSKPWSRDELLEKVHEALRPCAPREAGPSAEPE